MTYNHSRFRLSDYDLKQFPGPRVGEPAPDFEFTGLDGGPVRLSDFRGRWLVIETASVSCMMYARNVDKIGRMRAKYPDVDWLVVYVREAHPGRSRPAHRNLAQKTALAQALKKDYDESRTVVVDSLVGEFHRAFGSLPNMVYVLNPAGEVAYRCDWLSASDLDRMLGQRPNFDTRQHTWTDDLHYPPVSLTVKILWRSGLAAMWDFLRAAPFLQRTHRESDRHYQSDGRDSDTLPARSGNN